MSAIDQAPPKRKAETDDPTVDDSDFESDSEDPDFINVNFDFRAPEEIDFAALKRLFQQLFYTHAVKLDLGGLADHVIKLAASQGVGTTIKIEGDEDQDPFAFVSGLEISSTSSQDSPAAASLTKYLLEVLAKSASSKDFHDLVKKASSSSSTAAPIAVVLHERMINMPPQVAPPLYRMLAEELDQARSAQSPAPTKPSHFLFFSRVFSADAFSDDEAMDEDDDDEATGLAGARKRRNKLAKREAKKQGAKKDAQKVRAVAHGSGVSGLGEEELGLFHPEDKAITKFATHSHTFRFPPPTDASGSFEAPLFGRIAAIPYDKLAEVLVQNEQDLVAV